MRDQLDVLLASLVGPQDHICLIDPPDHPNVGDQAILLGELAFLRRRYPSARVSIYDVNSYTSSADRHIDSASILLIHGGGNFGDIWPHHHALRKRVLMQFAHKRIIQLPQSIHFSNALELKETAELIRKQSDFTLLVRDLRSRDFARRHFDCVTQLCLDMAFAMDPPKRGTPALDVFCLLRTDKEVAANHAEIAEHLKEAGVRFSVGDWILEPSTLIKKLDREAARLTRNRPRLGASSGALRLRVRQKYAEQRLEHGVALLSAGRTVVTDRLHAHIISCLLNIPNVVFDSWDGKIRAFYETWTKGHYPAVMASSVLDLREGLIELEHATA